MTGTIPCHVLHFVIKVNNEENRHFDSRIIKETLEDNQGDSRGLSRRLSRIIKETLEDYQEDSRG